MSFDSTIDLSPRTSMRALMAIFLLHMTVAAALVATMPSGGPMAAAAGFVGLSWLRVRRHPVLGFGPRALTRLTWHAEGGWTVHDASGTAHDAELQGNSLIHSRLLVLNFRLNPRSGLRTDPTVIGGVKLKAGSRRTRILAGDELEAEQFRQLRARLGQN